tara:strand:- start:28250 stop:28537 length:288 start_codon:yes stop_codon:yes gene_type:complete
MTEDQKQKLLENLNVLTYSVLEKIKESEDRLIKKILLKRLDVEKIGGKQLSRIEKVYSKENTNNYKLIYAGIYIGDVVFNMQDKTLDIEFIENGN